MTSLPKQVQEADDLANKMLKEIGGNDETSQAVKPDLAVIDPTQPAAAAPNQPTPAQEPASLTVEQQLGAMTQKYNVINGKYNAEVPSLYDQMKGRDKRILELEDELKATQASQTPAPEPTEAEDDGLDEYPDAIVDRLRSFEVLQSTVQKQQKIIESLQNTSANTVDNQFKSKLTELVPNWREINADQEFIGWLNTTREASSNQLQMDNLNNAHRNADHQRVAYIFNLWLSHAGRVNTPTPGAQQSNGNLPPVVPATTNANQPLPTEGRIYSKEWIKNFAKLEAIGETGMTPEQITRVNQDIDAAQFIPGRIID